MQAVLRRIPKLTGMPTLDRMPERAGKPMLWRIPELTGMPTLDRMPEMAGKPMLRRMPELKILSSYIPST